MCGYYTRFGGEFAIYPFPDKATTKLINKLVGNRRIAYDTTRLAKLAGISEGECIAKWGVEGEFFFPKKAHLLGKVWWKDAILDSKRHPIRQPDMINFWRIDEDNGSLKVMMDECSFYHYDLWLVYIRDIILKPRGYTLVGSVSWGGDDAYDIGVITINNDQNICVDKWGQQRRIL